MRVDGGRGGKKKEERRSRKEERRVGRMVVYLGSVPRDVEGRQR